MQWLCSIRHVIHFTLFTLDYFVLFQIKQRLLYTCFNIQVISLDGKEVRTLLTREDGIQRPQSVAINSTGDKLLVSSCPPYNNDYVSIFDLKYKKGERRRPVTAQPVVRAHKQSDLCSVS